MQGLEGWGEDANTVEVVLARSLQQASGNTKPDTPTQSRMKGCSTVAADTCEGVHAVANVVTATVPQLDGDDLARNKWLTAVNDSLPADVRVFDRNAVPAQFNANSQCDRRR